MHANKQTQYVGYVCNSSYINWKQNKTHIHFAKAKANFSAVNIGASIVSDIRIVSPKYWNIGQRKFYANCLTLVTTIFKHSFHPYSHNATQGFVQCTHSPHATYNVGMLNDNRKIDYRNRFSFSFSCLYYRLLKWVRVHWQQLGQKERLLALLIIKVKPLTSVDTSPVGLLLL